MDIALIIILPLIAVALIMLPVIMAILRKRSGKTAHPKRAVITNIASFFGVMLTMTILPLTGAFAASSGFVPTDILRVYDNSKTGKNVSASLGEWSTKVRNNLLARGSAS